MSDQNETKQSKYFLHAEGVYIGSVKALLIRVPFYGISRFNPESLAQCQTFVRQLLRSLEIDASGPILLAGQDHMGEWHVLGDPQLVPAALDFVRKNPRWAELPLGDNPILPP